MACAQHVMKGAVVVTGVGWRPHVEDESCWCKPERVDCQCGTPHGPVWGHGVCQLTVSDHPVLMVFSR